MIKTIQENPSKGFHSKAVLELAADTGFHVIYELVLKYPKINDLRSRYRSLIFALAKGNIELRLKLINGEIQPKKFVIMTEKELASDETKKVTSELESKVFETLRTDAILEF